RRDRWLRRFVLPLLRGYRSRPARPLEGLGMPLRSGSDRRASLLAFGWTRLGTEGVLCGAQPAFSDREEFSGKPPVACAALLIVPLLLALPVRPAGRRRGRTIRAGESRRRRSCVLRISRLRRVVPPCSETLARAPHHSAHTPPNDTPVSPADSPLWNFVPAGCGAVRSANGPDDVLILIPAFNEEAAIGQVIREVRQYMPQAAILAADDCSLDSTRSQALMAGAGVLSLPYHLGLGGCVQAGYRLAFELGFHYVIRVDGDGQHDPRDIPRIFETLRKTGCHMVIGSRFIEE